MRATYCLGHIVYLSQGEHVDDAAGEDDQCTQPVSLVVLDILDAAGAKDHVEGNVEVEQANQEPDGNDVGGPEEEERLEHVEQAKRTN